MGFVLPPTPSGATQGSPNERGLRTHPPSPVTVETIRLQCCCRCLNYKIVFLICLLFPLSFPTFGCPCALGQRACCLMEELPAGTVHISSERKTSLLSAAHIISLQALTVPKMLKTRDGEGGERREKIKLY